MARLFTFAAVGMGLIELYAAVLCIAHVETQDAIYFGNMRGWIDLSPTSESQRRLLLLYSYWTGVSKTLFSLLLFVVGLCSSQPLARAMAAASVIITFGVHYISMMPLLAEMQKHKEVGVDGNADVYGLLLASIWGFLVPLFGVSFVLELLEWRKEKRSSSDSKGDPDKKSK